MDKKIIQKTNSRDINSLIQILKRKFQDSGKDIIEYNELKKDFDIDDIGHQVICDELRNNPKIHYNEVKRQFSLKKKYSINNKQDLNYFLKQQYQGVEYNCELLESYKNIQNDLDILKQDNRIRSIETKNPGKKTVIFGKDSKYDNLNIKIPESLTNLFTNKIQEIQELFPQKIIQLQEQIKKDTNKKKKRKLRHYQIFNSWMTDQINFSEVIQAKEEEYKQYLESRRPLQNKGKIFKSKFLKQ